MRRLRGPKGEGARVPLAALPGPGERQEAALPLAKDPALGPGQEPRRRLRQAHPDAVIACAKAKFRFAPGFSTLKKTSGAQSAAEAPASPPTGAGRLRLRRL